MKTATEIVGLIATVCGSEGPTGTCREVLEVAVCDYGGNEYGRATTPAGVTRILKRLRIATRLLATKVGRIVSCEAHDPEYTIDCGLCA